MYVSVVSDAGTACPAVGIRVGLLGATRPLGSERRQESEVPKAASLGLCCFGVGASGIRDFRMLNKPPSFVLFLFLPEYNIVLFSVLFRGSLFLVAVLRMINSLDIHN